MTGWDDAGRRHGTDKSSSGHDYLRVYEGIFGARPVRSVLEIGVDEGRSLLTWADLWPGADIWGVELRRDAPLLVLAGCTVLFGDATTAATVGELPPLGWDVVVDDGSHQFDDQAASVALLAPLLSEHGVYVIEDVPWDDDLPDAATVDRLLTVMAASGLRPLGVAWSALRQHAAVVAERRP